MKSPQAVYYTLLLFLIMDNGGKYIAEPISILLPMANSFCLNFFFFLFFSFVTPLLCSIFFVPGHWSTFTQRSCHRTGNVPTGCNWFHFHSSICFRVTRHSVQTLKTKGRLKCMCICLHANTNLDLPIHVELCLCN